LKRQEGERENNHVGDYSGNPEIAQLAAHPVPENGKRQPGGRRFCPAFLPRK
jgi:hypothetical protein